MHLPFSLTPGVAALFKRQQRSPLYHSSPAGRDVAIPNGGDMSSASLFAIVVVLGSQGLTFATRHPQAPEIVYVDPDGVFSDSGDEAIAAVVEPTNDDKDVFSDSGDDAIRAVSLPSPGPEPMDVDYPSQEPIAGPSNLDAKTQGAIPKRRTAPSTDDSDYLDAVLNSVRPDVPEAGPSQIYSGGSEIVPLGQRSRSSSTSTTDEMLAALGLPEGEERTAIVRRIGSDLALKHMQNPSVPEPWSSGIKVPSANAYTQTYISLPGRISDRMERTVAAALHDRHRQALGPSRPQGHPYVDANPWLHSRDIVTAPVANFGTVQVPRWPAFMRDINAETQTPLSWTHLTAPALQPYLNMPILRGIHSSYRGGTYISLPTAIRPFIPATTDANGISSGRAPFATELFVRDPHLQDQEARRYQRRGGQFDSYQQAGAALRKRFRRDGARVGNHRLLRQSRKTVRLRPGRRPEEM